MPAWSRPFLHEDEAGKYTQGSLEVEVVVERDTAWSSLDSFEGWLPGASRAAARLGGPATVSDDGIDHCSEQYRSDQPLSKMCSLETVEAGDGKGHRQPPALAISSREELKIYCTLIDTAAEERFPLDFAGTLPDSQMGLPPGDARQQAHRGAASRRRGSALWGVARKTRAEAEMNMPMTSTSTYLFRLGVPGAVRAWSAEDPQLYTLVVELRGRGRESSQFESARVGFRSVRVHSGQLLVNGRAVMVAGVNRHEHDPDTGKCISEESMRRDIVMMKRYCSRSDRFSPFVLSYILFFYCGTGDSELDCMGISLLGDAQVLCGVSG